MTAIKVSLVNLTSPSYYVRPLGPSAVRILGGYLRAKSAAPVDVNILDMQGALESRDYSRILDHNTRYARVLKDMSDKITAERPDIVGLSMKWETLDAAAYFVDKLRMMRPNPLIVAGNSISTFGGRELLSDPHFAGICTVEGEGEEALRQIVERASGVSDIGNPENYAGISNVRISPEGVITRQALDLANYPVLTQDNAPELFSDVWGLGLEFSRGCSWHKCAFCSIRGLYQNSDDQHVWRPFSVELMMDRMERFIRLGRDSFWTPNNFDDFEFWANDSEFLGSMENEKFDETIQRAEEIAKGIMALKARYGNIFISHFSARVDTIFKDGEDEKNKRRIELYKTLKRAGFRQVYLGIESGSNTQLRRTYCKGATVEQNREAMRLLREVIGMPYEVGFIFFSPEDTMEVIRDNWTFIDETRLDENGSRIFGSLRPQAGSPLTRRLIKKGLVSENIVLNTVSHNVMRYEHKEVGEVARLFGLWDSQSIDLMRYLNDAWKWEGNDVRRSVLKGFIDRIRILDKSFLRACIDVNGGKPDISMFSSKFLAIIQDLRTALQNGDIDEHESGTLCNLLDRSTENNTTITGKINS